MKRNDYIALIIEHTVNQGYTTGEFADSFVNYIINDLVNMSMEELENTLDELETNAIGLQQ